MADKTDADPIPFDEVTDKQVYQAYLNCRAVSDYNSWEEARSNPALYLALKHQAAFAPVIAQKQRRQAEWEASDKPLNSDSAFIKNTCVLSRTQALQIIAAADLARSCLLCSFLSESSREEAIVQLRNVRAIFSSKKSGINKSKKR